MPKNRPVARMNQKWGLRDDAIDLRGGSLGDNKKRLIACLFKEGLIKRAIEVIGEVVNMDMRKVKPGDRLDIRKLQRDYSLWMLNQAAGKPTQGVDFTSGGKQFNLIQLVQAAEDHDRKLKMAGMVPSRNNGEIDKSGEVIEGEFSPMDNGKEGGNGNGEEGKEIVGIEEGAQNGTN